MSNERKPTCYVEGCGEVAQRTWVKIGTTGVRLSNAAFCPKHEGWNDDAIEWVCRGVRPAEVPE